MSANQSPSQPGLLVSAMAVIVIAVVGSVAIDAFVKEAPRISARAAAPTHATIKDFNGPAVFGCASKAHMQELESLADGYDRVAAVRFAFRHCEHFRTRERVQIECCDRDRWVSIRRPGAERTYWTASGNIEPERAP